MPQRNDPDYAPINDVDPPKAPPEEAYIPQEETEILEDDIKKLGALDSESADANKSLNRVVKQKKGGKSHVPWNAADPIKFNEASRLFSANASVYVDQILPVDVHVDTIPLIQAPDWGSFTKIIKERYWRGEDTEYKWQIVQYGNMIRAVGKLKLQADPRVRAKWDPNNNQVAQMPDNRQEVQTPLSMPGMAGVASPMNPNMGYMFMQPQQQQPVSQQQPSTDDPRFTFLFDTLRGLDNKVSEIVSSRQQPISQPVSNDPAFNSHLQGIQSQISSAAAEEDDDDYVEDDDDYVEDDDDDDYVEDRRRRGKRRKRFDHMPPMPPPPMYMQVPTGFGNPPVSNLPGIGMPQINQQQQPMQQQQQSMQQQQQSMQQQQQSMQQQQQSMQQQQQPTTEDKYLDLMTKLTEEVVSLKKEVQEQKEKHQQVTVPPLPPPPTASIGIPQGMLNIPGSLNFTSEGNFNPPIVYETKPVQQPVQQQPVQQQPVQQQPIQAIPQPVIQQQPIQAPLPQQVTQQFLPPIPPPPQQDNQIQYVPVPLPPVPVQETQHQNTQHQNTQQQQPVVASQQQSIQEQINGFNNFFDTIKTAAQQLGISNPGTADSQQSTQTSSTEGSESKDPYDGMPFRVVKTPGWNFAYDNETGKPMDWLTTAFINSEHLGGIAKVIGGKWAQIQEQIALQGGNASPGQVNNLQAIEQKMRQIVGENQQLKIELQRRNQQGPPPPQAQQEAIVEPPPIESDTNQGPPVTRNSLLNAVRRG